MNIFVSDCGYDVNVHDNQTMWFELQCGKALLESGRYREALKEFNWVQKHLDNMYDDQFDYLNYAFRRQTILAFEELISMMDEELMRNRYAIQNALQLVRFYFQVDKKRQAEKEKHDASIEDYKKSPEYEKLQKDSLKQEDEDEYKMDSDPQGYTAYSSFLEGKEQLSAFVEKVCSLNKDAPELQAKAMGLFLAKGKLFAAIRAGINLQECHVTNPRRIAALAKLFAHWISLDDAAKLSQAGDERMLAVAKEEMEKLGCPQSLAAIREWAHAEKTKFSFHTIVLTHDLVKLDLKVFKHKEAANTVEKAATDVMMAHAQQRKTTTDVGLPKLRVWDVVALHKTLKKVDGFQDSQFKEAAQELFPYSTYFNNSD